MATIRTGSTVRWPWGAATATGKVVERFERTVERTLQGAAITKHGTRLNPAYLIRQENGHEVLKLRSELAT